MNLEVLSELDNLIPYNSEKFEKFISLASDGFNDKDKVVNIMSSEVKLVSFVGIDLKQLMETAILVAAQNIKESQSFDKLAARLLLTNIYQSSLKKYSDATDFGKLYRQSFADYLNYGYESKLLNMRMKEVYSDEDVELIASLLKPENDEVFNFIGLDTALKRYFKLDWNQKPIETPQFMWMRIAMWMAIEEKDKLGWVEKFYNKLSTLEYIPGGSTNIGAGTTYPTLSNCYLLDTEDDTTHIFDNVKNVALISKATGGIGLSVTKLRASGSPVKSNNTFSTGPIPFIKVMDATLKSMARAGKKHGAMCIYMENWHYDFPEFIDLKQNSGDDYRRVRTADTAVYISDEFMKRVEAGAMWYLFDPAETPDLAELYGAEFSKRYSEYCEMAEAGKIRLFKKVPAREQMKAILTSLLTTSHPWLTWKDAMNVRALNNNTGTIHSSNLCTEICLPQDRNNIAVCNLAYINLAKHLTFSGGKADMNWDQLAESTRVSIRHLDNLVDVNLLTVPEARNSDQANRALGLGMSGLAEVFERFGFAYDSEEAYDLSDRIIEFISYYAIEESADLAKEKGSYSNFVGSRWSQGMVPLDTIKVLAENRGGAAANSSGFQNADATSMTLQNLKEQLTSKMQNSTDPNKEDLYEILSQLTKYVEKLSDVPASNNSSVSSSLKQNSGHTLDWDALRNKVKQGMRNATLLAIAPNASTGLVLGTTPGIDVRFSQVFSRATSRGKYLDVNPNLMRDLTELGLWDQVKDRLIEHYGDVSMIPEIPENLKKVYRTSFQVSPYGVIEVASRAQKWIDQALSRNMYLETRDIDELVNIYSEAWRRGLKTTYYLHSKPRHASEQSTVKVNKSETINKSGFARVAAAASRPTVIETKMEEITVEKITIAEPVVNIAVAMDPVDAQPVVASHQDVAIDEKTVGASHGTPSTPVAVTPKFNPAEVFACPTDPAERALCEACQ